MHFHTFVSIYLLWITYITDACAKNYRPQKEIPEMYIMGGHAIPITYAPYHVQYGTKCGGTIIDPKWILTAAHCGDEFTFVVAGSTKHNQGKVYSVKEHFIHPQWFEKEKDHPFDGDYQLLLLEEPVPVSDESKPIDIGTQEDLVAGESITIVGWGITSAKGKIVPDLQSVNLPIIDHNECSDLGGTYLNITDNMICAGFPEGNKDACQGDSGGGAVANEKLVGIVSFGVGCGEANHPGVYANVPMVRSWIRSVTNLDL